LAIGRPNQARCADIICRPMWRGFLCLVAVMDRATRKALAWRGFGRPGICNTGQGSQFTLPRVTGLLQQAGVHISMDGRGRQMDNLLIEWLWHSLKCGFELRAGLTRWIGYCNIRRPQGALAGLDPARRMGQMR
jgi:putative transposase